MLTEQEIQSVAEHYISFIGNNKVELIIYHHRTIKKPYGNIYFFNSKRHAETGDINYSMVRGPFLVEKETGRVVNFGTTYPNEYYFEAYENGTLEPSLDRYWYPDEEKYDFK